MGAYSIKQDSTMSLRALYPSEMHAHAYQRHTQNIHANITQDKCPSTAQINNKIVTS